MSDHDEGGKGLNHDYAIDRKGKVMRRADATLTLPNGQTIKAKEMHEKTEEELTKVWVPSPVLSFTATLYWPDCRTYGDLMMESERLLKRMSGLSDKRAEVLVRYRDLCDRLCLIEKERRDLLLLAEERRPRKCQVGSEGGCDCPSCKPNS